MNMNHWKYEPSMHRSTYQALNALKYGKELSYNALKYGKELTVL